MQDALCISYPASNPNVVAVGGTNTPLGLNNQLAGPITGWGTQTQNGAGPSGSGGGVSTLYTQPTYQNGVVSSSDRTVPDVSANADLETGDAVLTNSGSGEGGPNINQVGGTSAAAPDLAAMWALVLQACAQSASCATGSGAKPYRAGNPDYSFYTAYKNKTAYAAAFYDVLYGSNAEFPECYYSGSCPAGTTEDPGYAAMTGYDLVTGIGAPYARNLIKALVGV
jgi:kumamolisin